MAECDGEGEKQSFSLGISLNRVLQGRLASLLLDSADIPQVASDVSGSVAQPKKHKTGSMRGSETHAWFIFSVNAGMDWDEGLGAT